MPTSSSQEFNIPEIKEFDAYIFKRTCPQCGYGWFPRTKDPKRCPHCQIWLRKQLGPETSQ